MVGHASILPADGNNSLLLCSFIFVPVERKLLCSSPPYLKCPHSQKSPLFIPLFLLLSGYSQCKKIPRIACLLLDIHNHSNFAELDLVETRNLALISTLLLLALEVYLQVHRNWEEG